MKTSRTTWRVKPASGTIKFGRTPPGSGPGYLGTVAGESIWGVPPIVVSRLQASPRCNISSKTTLLIRSCTGPLGCLIDQRAHR